MKKSTPPANIPFAALRKELSDIEAGKTLPLSTNPKARKRKHEVFVGVLGPKGRLLYCLREKIAELGSKSKAAIAFIQPGYSELDCKNPIKGLPSLAVPASVLSAVRQLDQLWQAVDTLLWLEVTVEVEFAACSNNAFSILRGWRIVASPAQKVAKA